MDPLIQNFPTVPRGTQYRCGLCGGGGGERCGRKCADLLEQRILNAGPENVAAFIVEPIGGGQDPGAHPHPGYFERAKEVCEKHDILFIADEILTGLGRTGTSFAMDRFDVTPDVILAGKGLTAGYAPAGAVLPHERVVDPFRDRAAGFGHGHTNTFHPTTAAIGAAVLEYTERRNLIENAANVGEHLGAHLQRLTDFDVVGDVRGAGMLHGVEFVADRATKAPLENGSKLREAIYTKGLENGLLLATGGGHLEGTSGDFLVVAPPLTTSRSEIETIVDRLYDTVGAAIERPTWRPTAPTDSHPLWTFSRHRHHGVRPRSGSRT